MNKALIVFAAAVACVMAGPPHPDAGPAGVLPGKLKNFYTRL